MNRPFRSSTETGVVTRLVSTRTTSFSAAFSAAFWAARSAGVGGGGSVVGSTVFFARGFAGTAFFCAGVRRERVWDNAVVANATINRIHKADRYIDRVLLGQRNLS